MKTYCTQNNGDCATCSLVNYGLDCANNPVETAAEELSIYDKTKAISKLGSYHKTFETIWAGIPEILKEQLTPEQLALIVETKSQSFHDGKASTGAEVIDGEIVWINHLDKGFDLSVLARLKSTETRTANKITYSGNLLDTHNRYRTHENAKAEEMRSAWEVSQLPRTEWGKWYYIEYPTETKWKLSQ